MLKSAFLHRESETCEIVQLLSGRVRTGSQVGSPQAVPQPSGRRPFPQARRAPPLVALAAPSKYGRRSKSISVSMDFFLLREKKGIIKWICTYLHDLCYTSVDNSISYFCVAITFICITMLHTRYSISLKLFWFQVFLLLSERKHTLLQHNHHCDLREEFSCFCH